LRIIIEKKHSCKGKILENTFLSGVVWKDMRKPYMTPASAAQPDVKVPEPRISLFVIILCRLLARLYLLLFYGVARVVLRGQKDLFGAFKRALEGKSRCIIAFRHPNGGEPQLLEWFFLFKLRRLAARAGVKFARFPHAVFIYGYEVVRWGGWVVRLIMPNVGAMPIHHSKVDSKGMARIYKAITDGPYPLALAPEGQVSYTTDSVPRLEQGAIRIGFHAADRMAHSGQDMPIEILPLAVHFRFGSWGKLTLARLIKRIEKFTCISKEAKKLPLLQRLKISRDHILAVNEKRYGLKVDPELPFEQRLDAVIDAALVSAEGILGVKSSEGELFARMYNLRQICWDRMILPGVDSLDGFTGIERGVADLSAGEAWHASRHLELVDLSWYFRVPLPADDAPLHRVIEYSQNLWDFANRSMGGAYSNRINIFPRRVIIQSAPVINLSERLPGYHEDKKTAINNAMQDLMDSYQYCIDEVNRTE
jgi:1-acyl-sn-glycerol-3-phosphate acyltransferase